MSRAVWHDEAATEAILRGAARGLRLWAEDVLAESQKIVPVARVKGGYLRDTGSVDVDERELRATISYESPPMGAGRARQPSNLAAFVHENLSYRHSSGKSAKYLEKPLQASEKSGLATVRGEIAEELL